MISKEQFYWYEAVRRSGVTNMFNCEMVSEVSDYRITGDKVLEIIKNYDSLAKKYLPDIEKEVDVDAEELRENWT